MNLKVIGGQTLSGEVSASGSKNSIVAILPASILFDQPVVVKNVPELDDVEVLVKVLESLGSKIDWDKVANVLTIDNSNLKERKLLKDETGNMKGAVMLWGALLGRFRQCQFEALPGGCTLGNRPVDSHFAMLKDLGVDIDESNSGIKMTGNSAEAASIWLTEMSPTVTSNAVMLATSLKGTTTIMGAASEPSVQDLCNFLIASGAKISGVGTNQIVVEGGLNLKSVTYTILSDHYEVTTLLALGACTGGEMIINNVPQDLTPIIREFAKFNVQIERKDDKLIVPANQDVRLVSSPGHTIVVRPQPWPSLPVDTLPLFIPFALKAKSGTVLFHNWMYESALFWTNELQKFGANIIILDPHRVMTVAGNKLTGAKVVSPYIIRAAVSLVMTALIAEGESTIMHTESLQRGHEDFVSKLTSLGAVIEKID